MPAPTKAIKTIAIRFKEYAGIRSQREVLQKREDELKKELSAAIERHGWSDDKGNEYLNFPEPIDGFEGIKRERRAVPYLDEEKALEIIREKGLERSCTMKVTVVNEDAVRAAQFEGKLSQDDIDAMFQWKINYAFKPEKSLPAPE